MVGRKNQKGFTIIELLVVIVIIGILIALTLPNLFSAQARGRDTDRKNDLKNLQAKLETYFNDNDKYPGTLPSTDAKISADDMKGPRNTTYTYTCDDATNCQSYELSATLENGKDKDATNGVYTVRSVNQPEPAAVPET
jgi:general secretion pathway protein G